MSNTEHEEVMQRLRNQFVITLCLAGIVLILVAGAIMLLSMDKNLGAGMLIDLIGYGAVGAGGYSLGTYRKGKFGGSPSTIALLMVLMVALVGVSGCSSQTGTWKIGLERAELTAEHSESGTTAAIDVKAILGPVGILGVINLVMEGDRQLLEVCTTGDVGGGALSYKVCVSCDLISSACWVCYGLGDTAECRSFGGAEGTGGGSLLGSPPP
jgi:hypothetical protein